MISSCTVLPITFDTVRVALTGTTLQSQVSVTDFYNALKTAIHSLYIYSLSCGSCLTLLCDPITAPLSDTECQNHMQESVEEYYLRRSLTSILPPIETYVPNRTDVGTVKMVNANEGYKGKFPPPIPLASFFCIILLTCRENPNSNNQAQ
jgi:hypothetical protein